MNKILQDLVNTREVASFIDNILVGTEEEKRYSKIVEKVVKRLAKNDLYVKLEKYKQKVKEVRFLGVVIGPERIKMKEEKIKAVLDWLTSKRIKDIQKFLELANYYRQFVKTFTFIAKLLHDLVKKKQKWNWMNRQEEVFIDLKKRFTKELVLVAPELDKKMRIEVNVSDMIMQGEEFCQ